MSSGLKRTVDGELRRQLHERGFERAGADLYDNPNLLEGGLVAHLHIAAEGTEHNDLRINGGVGIYDPEVDAALPKAPAESLDYISLQSNRQHWFLIETPWRTISPTESMGPLEWWARDDETAVAAVDNVMIFVDQYVIPWLSSLSSPSNLLTEIQKYQSGICISTIRANAARAALHGDADRARAILDHWRSTLPDPNEDRTALTGWQRRAPQRKESAEKLDTFLSWIAKLATEGR